MRVREKFKNLFEELYEKKPISIYVISNTFDFLSTYMGVKKYGIESEMSDLIKGVFYSFGL